MSQQDAQNTAMPEKMELTSLNIADHQKQKLKELFPEVFTEGNKIDFDQLKRTLGEMVDGGKERFGMQWAGKADCFKTIQQPSLATLVPCPEESIDFDTTENVFIEGDNLEVLKLLQKGYLGKVKMIYIDPPYNTGNDFVYPDNYSDNLDTYLEYTGQVSREGKKFNTNIDTDGRFHSRWMNMMYPRLFLAKNLLTKDGVIFISIDDNEVKNLRSLCDEIFGEENFVANLIWQKKYSPQNDAKWFSNMHDHIICYARDKEIWRPVLLKRSDEQNARYSNPDNDPRGDWKATDFSVKTYSEANDYEITLPSGRVVRPPQSRCWVTSKEKFESLVSDNRIWFGSSGNNVPSVKKFISEVKQGVTPSTILFREEVGDNQEAAKEIRELFESAPFDTPKPTRLIKRLMQLSVTSNDLVLDFFAGSSTTAHAVMAMNKEDGGHRKYFCVQLPQITEEKSEAFKSGYTNIADISKERIRRASKKTEEELLSEIESCERMIELIREKINQLKAKPADSARFDAENEQNQKIAEYQDRIASIRCILDKIDLGFRVFKLQKSNFSVWDSSFTTDADQIAKQLDMHVDHISPKAEQQAILFELLIKAGLELTTPIDTLTLADKTVYSVQDKDKKTCICLEKQLTLEVMHAIADLEPSRVIVLDEGFQNNDQLKTNASLTLKSKGILDFRTV